MENFFLDYFVGEIWPAHVSDRLDEIHRHLWLIINKRSSINQTLLIWWHVSYVSGSSRRRMTRFLSYDKCLRFLILSLCHLSSTSATQKMKNLPSRERDRERERIVALLRTLERSLTLIFPAVPLMRSISVCVFVCLSNTHTDTKDSKSTEGSFIQKLDFCRRLLTLVSLQTRFPEQQIVFTVQCSLLSQKINESLTDVTLFNHF